MVGERLWRADGSSDGALGIVIEAAIARNGVLVGSVRDVLDCPSAVDTN